MELAQFHLLAQRADVQGLFQMLVNQTAKALRQFGLRGADGRFVGAAAQAGAKPCLTRGLRQREEENAYTPRLPRRARRAAINAGRTNSVIEQPGIIRAQRPDRVPTPVSSQQPART